MPKPRVYVHRDVLPSVRATAAEEFRVVGEVGEFVEVDFGKGAVTIATSSSRHRLELRENHTYVFLPLWMRSCNTIRLFTVTPEEEKPFVVLSIRHDTIASICSPDFTRRYVVEGGELKRREGLAEDVREELKRIKRDVEAILKRISGLVSSLEGHVV